MTIIGQLSRHNQTGNVHNIPNELIFNIMTYLSWRDVVRWRRVCRWLRDEVDHSVNFQYKIALGVSSLEGGPKSGPLTTAEKLRLLNAQQQGWRSLTFRKIINFPIAFTASESYSTLSGGTFMLRPTRDKRSLQYMQLPPTKEVENRSELKWTHITLDFEVSDFTLDEEQDLLVLIETLDTRPHISFHFWTLSTHLPHPAARRPIFEHPGRSWRRFKSRARISGSHIALLFSSPNYSDPDCLLIYSWVTGDKRAYVKAPSGSKLASFAFVSSQVFVVPSETELDLYSFNPQSAIDPPPTLKPVVSFRYPARYKPKASRCVSYPQPRGDSSHVKSDIIGTPHPTHFSMDCEDGIIVVWLQSENVSGRLIVHRKALLDGWKNSKGVKIVDWKNWGPKNTRWFEDPRSGTKFTVYGHRLLKLESAGNTTGSMFVVYDFNPVTVSQALTRSVASDLVTAPNTLVGGRVFEKDTHLELPYLEARSSAPLIPLGGILCNQKVLLVQGTGGISGNSMLILM